MESIAVVILISAGVIAISAVLFVAWVMVTMVRLIFRGIVALFAPDGNPRPRMVTCTHRDCSADNASHARFCRRCGRSMDGRVGSGVVRTV